MPYCTACGDSFPFLEAETCNGCTALDQCATTEEKTNLMEAKSPSLYVLNSSLTHNSTDYILKDVPWLQCILSILTKTTLRPVCPQVYL